jgi:hypothetical protein
MRDNQLHAGFTTMVKTPVDRQEPDDEFPVPRVGDRLFERGKLSIIDRALVEDHDLRRFYRMKDGYKLAGDVLVQRWLTQSRTLYGDSLVYPILFCYRHFLELSMEWILWQREEYRSTSIFKEHDLRRLWHKCLLIFQDVNIDADPQVVASEKLILEMHEMDEGSFNFRYTHDKKGKVIDLGIGRVDLIRLREGIEKLDNFFDIADTIIDVELDARWDFA